MNSNIPPTGLSQKCPLPLARYLQQAGCQAHQRASLHTEVVQPLVKSIDSVSGSWGPGASPEGKKQEVLLSLLQGTLAKG